MVTIERKTINKKKYYYLRHSIKVDKKVLKKEKYLGKKIPDNIETIKKKFEEEIKDEQWFSKLDKIKVNFNKEFKKIPSAAKRKYFKQFAIKFTYDTDRIEGSTLTLKETADLLEEGIAPRKPIKDIKEAQAHEKIFYIMMDIKELNLKEILYWHKIMFQDTEHEIAGKVRRHNVGIARSKTEFPSWPEIDTLLYDFFRWYNKNKDKIHPVELAALVHLKFVSIHPFTDGNGRISRLMMNFILKKKQYPMFNIEYKNRNSYYNALEKSQIRKEDPFFVRHIIHRYLKEYKGYL